MSYTCMYMTIEAIMSLYIYDKTIEAIMSLYIYDKTIEAIMSLYIYDKDNRGYNEFIHI